VTEGSNSCLPLTRHTAYLGRYKYLVYEERSSRGLHPQALTLLGTLIQVPIYGWSVQKSTHYSVLAWCSCTDAMASLLFMAVAASAASLAGRNYPTSDPLAACPGYAASNVKTTATGLTASLTLAGHGCNVYGTDLKDLTLEVSYDTGKTTQNIVFRRTNSPWTRLEASCQNPRCRERCVPGP
jgi:hypothetical protein